MALKGFSKALKDAQSRAGKSLSPALELLKELDNIIKQENPQRKPKPNYKPSMIDGCVRKMYFCMIEEDIDPATPDPTLIGMGESGTDRHERIQNYLAKLNKLTQDWQWVNVKTYITKFKPDGTVFEKKIGNEYKLRNDIYGFSFMCDGLLYNKKLGKYFILEIKTQTSRKHQGQTDVWEAHKKQATCYSIALGIDDVIFVYENRDLCTRIAYDIQVTDDMKDEIIGKIEECDAHLQNNTIPPKDTSGGCKYCPYSKACAKWGN